MNRVGSLKTRLKRDAINLRRKFKQDCADYLRKNSYPSFKIKDENLQMLYEYSDYAGNLDEHYFLQDIVMAHEIFKEKPDMHYDIGSRIDGFVAHLLSYNQEVTLLDIRPLNISLSKLHFVQTDATMLEEIEDESIESLSSLHAIEHFGLGRYGDKIDPSACFTAMRSMQNKVKKCGKIYLSIPIGSEEKVCFNSHRIFSPKTIIKEFESMKLLKFMYIQDLRVNLVEDLDKFDENILGEYDCGLFIFEK